MKKKGDKQKPGDIKKPVDIKKLGGIQKPRGKKKPGGMQKKPDSIQKKFCCPVCCKILRKLAYLNVHLTLAHKDQRHICRICEKVFYTNLELENHHNLAHSKQMFDCVFCKRQYSVKAELMIHFKKHSDYISRNKERLQEEGKKLPKMLFGCNVCEECFVGEDNLDNHMRAHVSSVEANSCFVKIKRVEEKSFSCHSCGIIFVNKDVLQMHIKRHNLGNLSNHNSEQDVKSIVLFSSTKRNITKGRKAKRKKTQLKEIYFSCPLCHKEFLRKGNFDRHKCTTMTDKRKKDNQSEFEFFDCGVSIKEEVKMECETDQTFIDPLSLHNPVTDAVIHQNTQYATEEFVLEVEDTPALQGSHGNVNANIPNSLTYPGREYKSKEIECITIDDDKPLPTVDINAPNPAEFSYDPDKSVYEYLDLSDKGAVEFLYYKDTKLFKMH